MCSVSDRPEAVQRGNAQRRCEVAIRTAARGALVDVNTEFSGNLSRRLEESGSIGCTLHRRAVNSTANLKRSAVEHRFQASNFFRDSRGFFGVVDSDVD